MGQRFLLFFAILFSYTLILADCWQDLAPRQEMRQFNRNIRSFPVFIENQYINDQMTINKKMSEVDRLMVSTLKHIPQLQKINSKLALAIINSNCISPQYFPNTSMTRFLGPLRQMGAYMSSAIILNIHDPQLITHKANFFYQNMGRAFWDLALTEEQRNQYAKLLNIKTVEENIKSFMTLFSYFVVAGDVPPNQLVVKEWANIAFKESISSQSFASTKVSSSTAYTPYNFAVEHSPPPGIDPRFLPSGLPEKWGYFVGPNELPKYFVLPVRLGYGFASAVDDAGAVFFGGFNGKIYRYGLDSEGKISSFSPVGPLRDLFPQLFVLYKKTGKGIYGASLMGGSFKNVYNQSDVLVDNGNYMIAPVRPVEDNYLSDFFVWNSVMDPVSGAYGAGSIQIKYGSMKWNLVNNIFLLMGISVLGRDVYYVNYTYTDHLNGIPFTPSVLSSFRNNAGNGLFKVSIDSPHIPPTLVVGNTFDYFWRVRGMSSDPVTESLYISEEANAWDQGNSGRITQVIPRLKQVNVVAQGIDYPNFPIWSPLDKRLYFYLTRDGYGAYVDPKAQWNSYPTGLPNVLLSVSGGTWQPVAKNSNVLFLLRNPNNPQEFLTIQGIINANAPHSTVSVWIKIPRQTYFPRMDIAPYVQIAPDGGFKVPEVVNFKAKVGTMSKPVVLANRVRGLHPRWPAFDGPGCKLCVANPWYSEWPLDYLVFFQWKNY